MDIANPNKHWFDPSSFVFSEIITFSGEVVLDCSQVIKNLKLWTVYKVNAVTGTTLESVKKIRELISHVTSSLFIPAKFLKPGLYLAVYNVSMEFPGFYDIAESYFEVVGSPIIALLTSSGLSSFTLGLQNTLELNPSLFSVDPDAEKGMSQVGCCDTIGYFTI